MKLFFRSVTGEWCIFFACDSSLTSLALPPPPPPPPLFRRRLLFNLEWRSTRNRRCRRFNRYVFSLLLECSILSKTLIQQNPCFFCSCCFNPSDSPPPTQDSNSQLIKILLVMTSSSFFFLPSLCFDTHSFVVPDSFF